MAQTLQTQKMTEDMTQLKTIEQQPNPKRKWWVLLAISLGSLMITLDMGIVNLSLTTLVQKLHASFGTIQWVALSEMFPVATLALGVGRLGDMFDKKRLYLCGMILFTISSLLCGLAPSVGWLIGLRALVGVGAVLMVALQVGIIAEVFPNSERGGAIGVITAMSALGLALGPTVGGLLIGLSGWRGIFSVNVALGIVSSLIAAYALPSLVPSKSKQSFDAAGVLLIVLCLGCFALAMTNGQNQGFSNGMTLGLLAVAGVGFVCFLALEANIEQPMLDLRLFGNIQFSLCLFMGFLVYGVVSGSLLILPLFLLLVKHYPTHLVGLLMFVSSVFAAIVAPVAGALSDRYGSRRICLIGLVSLALGCLLIGTFDTSLTALGYVLRFIPYGVGLGMFVSPNASAIMGGVPKERLGIVSGLLDLTNELGYTLGASIVGALFAILTVTQAHLVPGADITTAPVSALVYGFQNVFRIEALTIGILAVLAALFWLLGTNDVAEISDMPVEGAE